MTALPYTDPTKLEGVEITPAPTYGQTATGYGGKIPTRYVIRYAGRSRRVYAASYGNSASLFVVVDGVGTYLDSDTEHALEEARDAFQA